MLDIDFLRGNSEKLKEIKVQEGFFYLTTDTGKLYTGLNNNLCYLGDIITVSTKVDLPPSSNYFYYIEEDNSFWKYNNKWVQLNSGIKEIKTELSDEGILLQLNEEIKVLIPNSFLGIKKITSNSLNVTQQNNNKINIELQWHEF